MIQNMRSDFSKQKTKIKKKGDNNLTQTILIKK